MDKDNKNELPEYFDSNEHSRHVAITLELVSGKKGRKVTLDEIGEYVQIYYNCLKKARNICKGIESAKDQKEEIEKHYIDIRMCYYGKHPLSYGLMNYTDNECFHEVPNRKNLAEHFKLKPSEKTDVLDKAIILFLVGDAFFTCINYQFYGGRFSWNQSEEHLFNNDNIEKNVENANKTLDNCLDLNISYKEIYNNLRVLTYAEKADDIFKISTNLIIL